MTPLARRGRQRAPPFVPPKRHSRQELPRFRAAVFPRTPSLEACPASPTPLARMRACHGFCRRPIPEGSGCRRSVPCPFPRDRGHELSRSGPGSLPPNSTGFFAGLVRLVLAGNDRSRHLPPDGLASLLALHESAGCRVLPSSPGPRPGQAAEDAPDRLLQLTCSVFKDGRTLPTRGSHGRLLARSPPGRSGVTPRRTPPRLAPCRPCPRRGFPFHLRPEGRRLPVLIRSSGPKTFVPDVRRHVRCDEIVRTSELPALGSISTGQALPMLSIDGSPEGFPPAGVA